MFLRKKSKQKEAGKERDSKWYSVYAGKDSYTSHYTDSNYYFIWTVIADRIRRYKTSHVLEIACGTGQLANLLLDKGLKNYTGFDFCPEFIQIAQKNVKNATFSVDDALKTTLLEDIDYDCIIATEFLEHVNEDLHVLKKIKPNTRVIASVPNFPYSSHVRFFSTLEEVHQRYSSLFQEFDVDFFYKGTKRERLQLFYIFDGITK